MTNDGDNETNRYEIVLLEDDPETLNLIKSRLEAREIIVHAYANGNEALKKILEDSNIGTLVTDIEIRYPYPDGKRSGPQGYNVVNDIPKKAPNHLLGVIVLTSLEQEDALDSQNLFQIRIHNFSKMKWLKLTDKEEIEKVFDALALLVKEYIEITPNRLLEEVRQLYPKSRWVCEQIDGKKIYSPYWGIYGKMWFSHHWKQIEKQISEKAFEIVQSYRGGETMRLRGEHLSLTENPNEITFQEHLIGRRVVYALKALEPAYWESMIRGEKSEDEEKAEITEATWEGITTEKTRNLVNELNKMAVILKELTQQHSEANKQIENAKKHEESELEDLKSKAYQIYEKIIHIKKNLKPLVDELMKALRDEPEEIQKGFVSYLRFLDADFTSGDWAKKRIQTGGGKDPLTQTLLLLGIRKQDIDSSESENWKLLLPEERKWLSHLLE